MRAKIKYKQLWIASVDIVASPGYKFNDLVDFSECNDTLPSYDGAWANIIVQAKQSMKQSIL